MLVREVRERTFFNGEKVVGVNISFIIPTYNPSEEKGYLFECLDSLEHVRQKGDEILVIDDGSTNYNYIKNTCNTYGKITLIRLGENRGISSARNIGIQACKNKYYTIVDSDDYIFDAKAFNRIRNQIKPSDKVDMYIFGSASIKNNELVRSIGAINAEDKEDLKINVLFNPFASYQPKLYSVGNAWAKIYRKDFTIKNNLIYEETPHRAEDHVFILDYLAANPKIKIIEEYAYLYRINEESVTHQYNPGAYVLINNTIRSLEKRIDLNNAKECKAMLYRKVNYIATAMKNVFHVENKSNFYSKYADTKAILWNEDNLDALQSVDFSEYSFGKNRWLLMMLKRNIILIPSILMEARRKAIIIKRLTITYAENIKSIINSIGMRLIFASRYNKRKTTINYIKSTEMKI